MNKRIKQMLGQAVVGTTLTAMAALGAGQMAQASDATGTCVTTGTFTESGTCTVLPGEKIMFSLRGGPGGEGGAGGAGGAGGIQTPPFIGGFGGAGGLGGGGGETPTIGGNYTNSTDATVTLTVVVGVSGLTGSAGAPGLDGTSGNPAGAGTDGGDGGMGTNGTESTISIDGSLIVSSNGGAGGTGGKGGKGGTGGSSETYGTAGAPGENGLRGASGAYVPSPLPESWGDYGFYLDPAEVTFYQDEPETTEPEYTVPNTQVLLPATGSDTSPTMLVTLLVLASGASLVVLARRRVVR